MSPTVAVVATGRTFGDTAAVHIADSTPLENHSAVPYSPSRADGPEEIRALFEAER